MMKCPRITGLSCVLLTCVLTFPAGAEEGPGLKEALAGGNPTIALRYRYENVSDDAVGDKEAGASTLRTTLTYETLAYKGWDFLLEAENVAAVGNDDLYNNAGAGSLSNGVSDRPVVADPEVTELNQVFIRYEHDKAIFALGRQEVLIGDHRFVGNVGWRQNHQSFDAFQVTSRSLDRLELTYSFLDRMHRIFGDSKDLASHLLNASYDVGDIGKLTGYVYLLDFQDARDAALSTATYGLELKGEKKLGGSRKILYEVELAEQGDYADHPGRVDAGYGHFTLGGSLPALTVKAGWEVLEGGPLGGQFSTPLATLHKFNGWADKFLRTPESGLEDLYLSLSGEAGEFSWTAVFHDFEAESASASASYGQELDLQLTYASPWDQVFGFKAALYDARDFAADTEKLMFWTSYKF